MVLVEPDVRARILIANIIQLTNVLPHRLPPAPCFRRFGACEAAPRADRFWGFVSRI